MFRTSLAASLLWLFVGSSLPGAERSLLEPFHLDKNAHYPWGSKEGRLSRSSAV